MDGSLPPLQPLAGLPAVPAPASVQQAQSQRPPGRPNADPEADAARVQAGAERRRILSVLPKQATDSKIKVFLKLDGRPTTKPCLIVLASELEEASKEGIDAERYITDKIVEKVRDPDGYYECRVYDRLNRTLPDVSAWEIKVGTPPEDEEGDGDEGGDDRDDLPPVPTMRRGGGYDEGLPPPPPAPAPGFQADMASSLRQVQAEEAKRSEGMLGIVTTLMQANQSQAQSQQATMMQTFANMQQMMVQMQMQQSREAQERETRERARKDDFLKLIVSSLPVLIPLIQGLFKKDDTALQVLIAQMKEKPAGTEVLQSMIPMLTETMRQSSAMQASAAANAMEQQAKVSGTLMDSMLERTLKLAGMGPAEAPKEDGLIDQIAKLAPIIGPLLAAQMGQGQAQQQAQPQGMPQQQPMAALPAPEARSPAPVPPVPQQSQPQAQAQAQQPAEPEPTPEARIAGALKTVSDMSIGKINPDERDRVLAYLAETIPPNLREAIVAGNQEQVMAICAPVVAEYPMLLTWLSRPTIPPFLEATVRDLGLVLRGEMTPERLAAGIADHVEFLRRRGGRPRRAATAPDASQAAPAPAADAAAPAQPPRAPAPPAPLVPDIRLTNTSDGGVAMAVESLTPTGWVPALPPYDFLPVAEKGMIQGVFMEENDASWVVRLTENGRVRVPKDKFRREAAAT